MMKSTKVYDLPTRLFHWVFALLFVGAFYIGKTYDDDSAIFPLHMLFGLTLAFVVVLRIVWGIIGSRHARFSAFSLNPMALLDYGKDMLTGKTRRYPGHNPASSWAALIMLGLALALAFTGYKMTSGAGSHFIKETHELLANAFVIVVLLHVAGIIFHTLRHRDQIGLSMIHGRKESFDESAGIQHPHALAGIVFLALLGVYSFNLWTNYNPKSQALNFFGTRLQLGESEDEGSESGSEAGGSENEKNEEDDD